MGSASHRDMCALVLSHTIAESKHDARWSCSRHSMSIRMTAAAAGKPIQTTLHRHDSRHTYSAATRVSVARPARCAARSARAARARSGGARRRPRATPPPPERARPLGSRPQPRRDARHRPRAHAPARSTARRAAVALLVAPPPSIRRPQEIRDAAKAGEHTREGSVSVPASRVRACTTRNHKSRPTGRVRSLPPRTRVCSRRRIARRPCRSRRSPRGPPGAPSATWNKPPRQPTVGRPPWEGYEPTWPARCARLG